MIVRMKYVVCVPDGCADEPLEALDGRTPLEAASMPTLSGLAAQGEVGRAAVIPDGCPPGSDVGNMSIFGYDPDRYHTGRAPIEAAALGLDLEAGQVAYRCNLVTIRDEVMVDFAGGHPASEDARKVIEALDDELGGDGVSFHPGVEYRHIVVAPSTWADAECVPPHDLTGKRVVWPLGPAAPHLLRLMEAAPPIVGRFGLTANQVWLWGQGHRPTMPSFSSLYGLDAALSSAVDLVRGLGVLTGIEVIDVDGMTAGYDTDYASQRECALDALADGADLFVIHVEATDECGHAGDVAGKVEGLERWDRRILQPLVTRLDDLGPWRMLVVPDHATPCARRTHTSDPVPFLMVRSTLDGPGGRFAEAAVRSCPPVAGHHLLPRLLSW
jgi:2,3-bisphosphoglycerate-independent phosphoglycerate mutase